MKTLIFNNPNYWNKAEAVKSINNYLCKLDVEGVQLKSITVKNNGTWTEDFEYIEDSFVYDAKELVKVEAKGEGTYVTSSFSFPGKEVITYMKKGFVMIVSHEVSEILGFFEERYGILRDYQDIVAKLNKQENKLSLLREEAKDALKEFKLQTEDKEEIEEFKDKFKDKIEKQKEKIESTKRIRASLKEQLGMASFNAQFLMSEGLYLLKSTIPVYTNKKAGVIVLEVNKRSSFTYQDFDQWTELANEYKHETLESFESKIEDFIQPFDSFEYRIKVPVMSGYMAPIENEKALEIDISRTISMAGSVPAAPVKPSIAAAMLASGTGGKLDKSIVLEGEDCLIKTAITPVQLTETIEVNGVEEVQRTFSWEPQLGKFNKLRKEFVILR